MLYKSDIFVLEKLKCCISGIPEARVTWGQNSRLVANGTSLLNVWDSPVFQSNILGQGFSSSDDMTAKIGFFRNAFVYQLNTPHDMITDSSKCQLNPETSAPELQSDCLVRKQFSKRPLQSSGGDV